jgi:hypothetical protein
MQSGGLPTLSRSDDYAARGHSEMGDLHAAALVFDYAATRAE